ncbi:MAG: CBS domain-containing protein [Candidatus Nanoarchaeia archaeon]
MIEDIRQIKEMRQSLNLSQKELAAHAGVSQSLIAKIESENIDPSYSKFKQILNTLNALYTKNQKTAKDVMMNSIIKLSPSNTLKDTISKMKKYNISQLPVFENRQPVGLISEHFILDALSEGFSLMRTVGEVMRNAPPTISGDASLNLITSMLKQYPLIIVSEKGKAKGIITKADLFNTIK